MSSIRDLQGTEVVTVSDSHVDVERRLTYPQLNPAFVVVRVDQQTLHIRAGPWTGPAVTITEVEADGDKAEQLFELFDGDTHVRDVLDKFPDDEAAIVSLMDRLADRNVLYDASEVSGNYGTPQFLPTPRFRDKQRQQLSETRALVVSTGRIGRQVASDLAESGVGVVSYARPLSDDTSNWTRLEQEEALQPVAASRLESAVERADTFLYAADREYPAVGEELSRLAHETKTPWMLAQRRGFDGLVGPTIFPGETGCYRCLERRLLASLDDEMYAPFRQSLDDTNRKPVGLPSYARTIAGYATTDFLNLLAYGQSFTTGRLLAVDFFDLSVTVNDVLRLPRCPVCGKDPGADRSRFLSTEDLVAATRAQHTEEE